MEGKEETKEQTSELPGVPAAAPKEQASDLPGVPATARSLTYGEKLVGVTFNPGGNPMVDECKKNYARIIDDLHHLSKQPGLTGEQKAHFKLAIREAQGAQMWAVKAITLPAIEE